MSHKIHNVGAARHIGPYRDAVGTEPDCDGCAPPAPRVGGMTACFPKESSPRRVSPEDLSWQLLRKPR
jgi:hypothetical protein